MSTHNIKGNGGVYETSPEKARAPLNRDYLVFCPTESCGEMGVIPPLSYCDSCGHPPHFDFECPCCGTRWLEWAAETKPVDSAPVLM